jgi:glycosyltransferase involved in cell wall biosynthesis
MNIIVLHNRYRIGGGEDVVAAAEAALMRARGHAVTLIEVDNHTIHGAVGAARAALGTAYNPWRRRWIASEVRRRRADVVHVHNYFPLLSPSVLDGAADAGAAVVHTLHNYRAVCASATLLRDGAVCERCLDGSRWNAVRHRCYRGSLPGTMAVAAMQTATQWLNLWDRPGRQLIALSRFARDKLIQGGLPAARLTVKPNFIDLPGTARCEPRSGVVFAGRLSVEKGAAVLVEAARDLPDIDFTLIGEGPEEARLRQAASSNIRFTGVLPREQVRAAIASARLLALPSLWYEGLPMTLLEAYAAGTPVIASRIGALAEWVEDGVTGSLIEPGDVSALSAAIRGAHEHPEAALAMGDAARVRAETLFSPETSGAALEAIYGRALAEIGRG